MEVIVTKLKKTKRNTGVRKRSAKYCLVANDQVKADKLKKCIICCAVKIKLLTRQSNTDESAIIQQINKLKSIIVNLGKLYLQLVSYSSIALERPLRKNRTIESFILTSTIQLRFEYDHLHRLKNLLQFPDTVIFDNRSKMSGEEVFLRGLYELSSGESKFNIAENVFGRHYSDQSRALKWFVNHIYDNFHHLVHDNLQWWLDSGYLAKSAEVIGEQLNLPPGVPNMFALFIDCNCLETSRPGGGPTDEGANSLRWSEDIQRAFYNGWKSIHGLKHQTVDTAFGITADMTGPDSLRRNDTTLLRSSNIVDRLRDLMANLNIDYLIFGDSAYKIESHLRSYYKLDNNDDNQQQQAYKDWNYRMKSVRESIEWNYMVTGTLFKYTSNLDKLRIMESPVISKIYTVATLLRNFHVCLYGSITSKNFGVVLDDNMLEQYVLQQ